MSDLNIRRSDVLFTRLIDLWPLWITLAGSLVAAIKFYGTVQDLAADQKAWKALSEQRRMENFQRDEEAKIRMTRLETDNEWIKWIIKGDSQNGQHQGMADRRTR